MRDILVVGLIIVACSATVAYGAKKSNRPSETMVLASEMASKIVAKPGTNISITSPAACRLHVNFESLAASFDLPLQGAKVSLTDADDGIVVESRYMTRTIKDRQAEAFEVLTLRFNRATAKSVLKSFSDAIASCSGTPAVVAGN